MCAVRLEIIARNARAVPRDDCEHRGPAPAFYDLNLSDEHMRHVARGAARRIRGHRLALDICDG